MTPPEAHRRGELRRQRVMLASVSLVVLAVVATLATTLEPPGPGPVVLNEVMSSNGATIADEDGDFSDWVELHNTSGQDQPLGGLHLTDDPADPEQWTFPQVTLGAGEYLVVWLSGKDRRDPARALHTNFALAQAGQPLLLFGPDGDAVDRIDAVSIPRDASYGRSPDDPGRWCFFAAPTPGADNDAPCHADADLGAPVFSAPSGFYDEPFELRIEADDRVYVTLDGSYPDPDGNAEATVVYEAPIRIADRSDEPDRFATIPTTFPFDASLHGDGWREPDGPQPKGTVVRARTASGRETVATYFVGDHHRRDQLPVANLATDGDHFFDHDRGIYVPGRIYEDWLSGPDGHEDHGWNVPANFSQVGRAWERPAPDDLARAVHLTWCEAGGSCTYETDLGVRIHGGYSRRLPAKSLRLYARNDFGNRTFDHDFFTAAQADTPTERRAPVGHRRLLIRNGGGTWGVSFLNDALFLDLARPLRIDTHAVQPMVLYLNGEYWGIHLLHERYDRHYLEAVHGVDPDEVTILEARFVLDTGVPGDEQHFLDVLDLLASDDPADPGTLQAVEARVDLDSFIDYVILKTFVSNTDWPHNNVQLWRTRTPDPQGPEVADGRWRWKAYDLDRTGGAVHPNDPDDDNLARLLAPVDDPRDGTGIPFLLQRLLANEVFAERFVSRYADTLNGVFTTERVEERLDELAGLLAPEMPRQVSRWGYPASVEEWEGYVDSLRNYARERPARQWAQLVDHLDLPGTVDVEVAGLDEPVAQVRLNTVALHPPGPGVDGGPDWRGTYAAGQRLVLRVLPEDGHVLAEVAGLPDDAEQRPIEGVPGGVAVSFLAEEDLELTLRIAPR